MKNKLKLLASLVFLTGITANAQVGVGTTAPDASSILDVVSTNKGFLLPRMQTAQRTAIVAPATGLQVYDTTTNTNWYFNGTVWVEIVSGASVTASNGLTLVASDVQLGGNLTASTTINQGTNNLTFAGTGQTVVSGTIKLDGPIYTTKYRLQTGATINADDVYIGVDVPATSFTLPAPTVAQTGRLIVFVDLTGGAGFAVVGANPISNNAPQLGGGALTYLCTGTSWVCINGY